MLEDNIALAYILWKEEEHSSIVGGGSAKPPEHMILLMGCSLIYRVPLLSAACSSSLYGGLTACGMGGGYRWRREEEHECI